MVKTKTTKKTKVDAVPTPSQSQVESGEQLDWSPSQDGELYVVTRGGLRVSDNDYLSPDWPQAIRERDFWQKVVDRYPDGTKIRIERYDKKKHRTY
jgi:hypothetical protein